MIKKNKSNQSYKMIKKQLGTVQACHASTQEVEAGASGAQGLLQLYRELQASLGYMRACFNQSMKLV